MGSGPTRTCVGCRTRRPLAELLCVVATPAGPVVVDSGRGRVPGRGAHVCGTRSCIDRALRSGALCRALGYEKSLPEELHSRLLQIAKGRDG